MLPLYTYIATSVPHNIEGHFHTYLYILLILSTKIVGIEVLVLWDRVEIKMTQADIFYYGHCEDLYVIRDFVVCICPCLDVLLYSQATKNLIRVNGITLSRHAMP